MALKNPLNLPQWSLNKLNFFSFSQRGRGDLKIGKSIFFKSIKSRFSNSAVYLLYEINKDLALKCQQEIKYSRYKFSVQGSSFIFSGWLMGSWYLPPGQLCIYHIIQTKHSFFLEMKLVFWSSSCSPKWISFFLKTFWCFCFLQKWCEHHKVQH